MILAFILGLIIGELIMLLAIGFCCGASSITPTKENGAVDNRCRRRHFIS